MAYEYISVSILCMINLLNYMDRFTIAGVLKDVQTAYDLNDTEGGLLQTSFIISYMIFAPLFGYLGDRYSRKYIMTFGVLFWSITTFCGSIIPRNLPVLFFFMRALVGVGEASYSTIAPTIIADLFSRTMRTRMLTLFYFAIPVGSGLGYVVGSFVTTEMHDWHWALRVTPIFGFLSAILLLIFLREPSRGQSDGVVIQSEHTNILDDVKYFMTVRSYIWTSAGFTCVCFAIGALSWWAPKYMGYALEVAGNKTSEESVSLKFGIITCLGGIIGVACGSGIAQLYRKYNPRADPLVCAFSIFGGAPFVFLGLVVSHKYPTMAWVFIFIGVTCLCVSWTLVADMLLYVIVPNRRSMAQSLQILMSHLLGDASSPFIVGAFADWFKGGRDSALVNYQSLQYSLYSTSFILILGGVAFLYASLFISSDQDMCKAKTQGQRSRNSSDTSIHTLPPNVAHANPYIDPNFYINSFPPSNNLIDSDTNNLIPNEF